MINSLVRETDDLSHLAIITDFLVNIANKIIVANALI